MGGLNSLKRHGKLKHPQPRQLSLRSFYSPSFSAWPIPAHNTESQRHGGDGGAGRRRGPRRAAPRGRGQVRLDRHAPRPPLDGQEAGGDDGARLAHPARGLRDQLQRRAVPQPVQDVGGVQPARGARKNDDDNNQILLSLLRACVWEAVPAHDWAECELPSPDTPGTPAAFLRPVPVRPQLILRAVEKVGYKKPSPIQMASIPVGLLGRDCIGIAETGSGKTAAFVIPMLAYIMKQPVMRGVEAIEAEGPYSIIMAPTRELAQQIEEETAKFAHYLDVRCFLSLPSTVVPLVPHVFFPRHVAPPPVSCFDLAS